MAGYPTPKKFTPKNRHKYKGDSTNIIARSSWETRVFRWLDELSFCVEWGSETTVIPYISPIDGKPHRYFTDLYIKFRQPDGAIKTFLVEIKPLAQCDYKAGKRKTKALLEQHMVVAVNHAKWEAAKEYARRRGWEFKVITEKDIGI